MSTKTLNEQVDEIVKSNESKAIKVAKLKELHITDYEIKLLVGSATATRTPRTRTSSYTFGVEIETFGSDFNLIRDNAQNAGVAVEFQGYNHNDNFSCFKFVTDASIAGANGIECVSPVLKGTSGFTALKKVCGLLNTAGARVNRSTGLHVHIGFGEKGISDSHYVNIFHNYKFLQKAVNQFLPSSRHDNGYARPFNCHNFDPYLTKTNIFDMLPSRYYAVNPQSWFRHRTIEFRQHSGTTDFTKIKMWVTFIIELVNYSKNNRLDRYVDTIENIPFVNKNSELYSYLINRRSELHSL